MLPYRQPAKNISLGALEALGGKAVVFTCPNQLAEHSWTECPSLNECWTSMKPAFVAKQVKMIRKTIEEIIVFPRVLEPEDQLDQAELQKLLEAALSHTGEDYWITDPGTWSCLKYFQHCTSRRHRFSEHATRFLCHPSHRQ